MEMVWIITIGLVLLLAAVIGLAHALKAAKVQEKQEEETPAEDEKQARLF